MKQRKKKLCCKCKKEFRKTALGRIRMTIKTENGESVAYLCPGCVRKMTFKERGGG